MRSQICTIGARRAGIQAIGCVFQLGEEIFRSPGLFGSKTRVWSVDGVLGGTGVASSDRQSFVLKHSFMRPGRVADGHYFMERVVWRAMEQNRRIEHWFPNSAGIWVDGRFRFKDPQSTPRVGVVHSMSTARGATWQQGGADASVADMLRAARDAVRIIAAMRPFHHRDVSLGNLMVYTDATADGYEDERMRPWLQWDKTGPAPPLVAQIIDFERGRWGEEPSDYTQRRRVEQGEPRDPDESIDNAHTGTLPFLARAQAAVRRIVMRRDEDDVEDLLDWVHKHGHHQY